MDRIGCFAAMGLWPKGCVAGTARLDFAGWHPREADRLLPHCRRIAALPLRAWGPCVRPAVTCLRSGTSPWPGGNQVWPAGVALAGGSLRFAPARMSPRRRTPSPPVRFVSHALAASSRAGAAYGCPGSGVGAPCLWCELGPVGPTCRSRWSGLGSGTDYRGNRRRLATCARRCSWKLRERLESAPPLCRAVRSTVT